MLPFSFSLVLFFFFFYWNLFLHIYHLYQLSRRAGPEKPANPQGLYKIPRKMSHVTYSHIKIYIYLHVCNLSKYYWEYHILFKHFCVYYQKLSLMAKSGPVGILRLELWLRKSGTGQQSRRAGAFLAGTPKPTGPVRVQLITHCCWELRGGGGGR